MVRTMLAAFGVALIYSLFAMQAAAGSPDDSRPTLDLTRLGAEWRPVVAVSVASAHIGAERDFQEFNPGGAIGFRSGLGWRRGEWGGEVGYFLNSYDEGSAYAGVWADWPVLALTDRLDLRLGAFFAYAEYPQLVDEAKDFGALTIGDFVPLLAAQASLRLDDRFALVARFGPGISDSDLILGFQAMYFF